MSSKRSKSRSRSKAPSSSYGPAEDEVKKSGFFPMMMGMTASLMLVLWIASFFNPNAGGKKVDTAEHSARVSARLMESSSFEQFVRDANTDQIVARLNSLKNSNSPPLSPAKVNESNQRIQLCKRLLKKKVTGKLLKFVKLEWLESEKTKYGIDFLGKMNSPRVSGEFEACFNRFLDDTDQEVQREAHLARVSHVVFECIKGGRTAQDLSNSFSETLNKFPGDDRVESIVRLQFKAAVEADVNLAKEVAEDILRKGSPEDEETAGFKQFVLDHYQIIKSNYREIFRSRFINGDDGLRELQKTSLQLVSNPEAGPLVVNMVNEVANWFEQRRQFENASQIYHAMVDAGQQNQSIAEAKGLLNKIGNAGVKRMDSVGKKIPISGTTLAGKQVEPDDFEGRIILVMFFQPNQKVSNRLLGLLEQSAKKYAAFGSPVRIVAVPSTDEPFESNAPRAFGKSQIHYFGWAEGQPPELLTAYPVTTFPHLMAIDHQGNVARANLDSKWYEREIENLVDMR